MTKRALISILGIFIIFSFLAVPFLVSSMEINIHVDPYKKVSIFILADQEQYYLLGSFHKDASGLGEVQVNYPGTEGKVKINIKISERVL